MVGLDLFRAEWTKITGHRWVVGCLIWIFPIAAFLLLVLMAVILALVDSARTEFASQSYLWTEQMIGVWSVPRDIFGRLLLVGFTAVMFAGEYQWGTWKNTVPRHNRVALITVKFATLGVLVLVTFVIMSIILGLGVGVLTMISGADYGPRITTDVLADFAGDYLLQMALAFTATLILAGYAALAAMLTRSILGGILIGLGLSFLEGLIPVGLFLIALFLDFPTVLHLSRIFPAYNLANISEWIINGKALETTIPFRDGEQIIYSDSLGFSLAMTTLWVVLLVGLTIYFFRRQDITS